MTRDILKTLSQRLEKDEYQIKILPVVLNGTKEFYKGSEQNSRCAIYDHNFAGRHTSPTYNKEKSSLFFGYRMDEKEHILLDQGVVEYQVKTKINQDSADPLRADETYQDILIVMKPEKTIINAKILFRPQAYLKSCFEKIKSREHTSVEIILQKYFVPQDMNQNRICITFQQQVVPDQIGNLVKDIETDFLERTNQHKRKSVKKVRFIEDVQDILLK